MKARTGKLGMKLISLLLTLILIGTLTSLFNLVAATSVPAKTNVISPNASHSNLASTDPPAMEWNRTYGGTGDDSFSSFVQTHDGGYALAGYTNSYGAGGGDAWLVKTGADGNALWNQTYGWALGDSASSLIQTDDDGYALAGVTIIDPTHDQNALFVKTGKDGKMQWNKTYFGRGSSSVACSLIQTRDGGYALGGRTTYFGGRSRFFLIKTDMRGNTQWVGSYGGTEPACAQALIQTNDGGYALAGFTGPALGPYDCFFVKTDAEGKMLWNRTFGGNKTDISWSLVQTDDHGYALLCTTYSFGAGENDLWLVKTDAVGEIQWNITYGGTSTDMGWYLVQTHDGGYALAGYTNSYGAGGGDAWLVKTGADGNALWNQTYGDTGYDAAQAMIQTDDGGYVLGGFTNSDGWLVKITAESIVFHDVAVTDFRTSKTGCAPVPSVGQNFTTNVTVAVKNQGSYTEIFNMTIYVDTTVVWTIEEVNLPSGNSAVINFAWNTSGFAMCSHTLDAFVWPISGENDTSDNIKYQWILVTGQGDINGDFVVDIYDAIFLANAYNSRPTSSNWNPNADINGDSVVDIYDAIIMANHYNQHYP